MTVSTDLYPQAACSNKHAVGHRRVCDCPTMSKSHATPFKALLSARQKLALWSSLSALSCTWVFFWSWWFLHVHGGLFRPTWTIADLLLTLVYALINYETMLVYGLLGRAQTIDPDGPIPFFRVAMIVTRAPSEPFEVVQTTLKAMLNQNYQYPYDVWLADERYTLCICNLHPSIAIDRCQPLAPSSIDNLHPQFESIPHLG